MDKQPIATGLTPEAPEGEKTVMREKKIKNQAIVKTLLLNQMTKKQEQEQEEKKKKNEYEEQLNQDNQKTLEMLKEIKLAQKEKAKKHWEEELNRSAIKNAVKI